MENDLIKWVENAVIKIERDTKFETSKCGHWIYVKTWFSNENNGYIKYNKKYYTPIREMQIEYKGKEDSSISFSILTEGHKIIIRPSGGFLDARKSLCDIFGSDLSELGYVIKNKSIGAEKLIL